MGIFRDKKSGNWGVRLQRNGKDIRKIIGPDKRHAELALREALNDTSIKQHADNDWEWAKNLKRYDTPRTFKDAAEDYMLERADIKPSSLASYNSILNVYLLPRFGKLALKDITESDIRKFQSSLHGKISGSRINTVSQLLRNILTQECRTGSINRDPSKAVKPVQGAKTAPDPLSEEELAIALSNVHQHYRPLFTVLAYTGARPNEMLALRWGDIDRRKQTITISKGRVRGIEGSPKTKSSMRTIVMTKPVLEAIEFLRKDSVRSKDDYVFTKPNGEPIDKHLDRIWARALRKAGMRHRPSYQLRHTFATLCIIKGLPLPFIARTLGHTTIDMLIRHYAGWIEDASKPHEAKLKELFNSTPQVLTLEKMAT